MNLPLIDIMVEAEGWSGEDDLADKISTAIRTVAVVADLKWPKEAELSVVFTSDAAMAELNGQWRNKPQSTNVLSFPGGDVAIGEPSDLIIGDLVFAFETVQKEAIEQEKTFDNHLTHLIIHGFLHLFGYDHISEKQAEQMENVEKTALAKLGIDDPYKDEH